MTEVVAADILAAWAAGVAGAGAMVAWWRIVGPGYLWLTAGTAGMLGGTAALLNGGPAVVGLALAVAGGVLAKRPTYAAATLAASSIVFVWAASGSGLVSMITAASFLGGVTAVMLLGHWYLVDPRLPRSALFRLDTIALVGLGAEVLLLVSKGVLRWAEGDGVLGAAFLVMAASSFVLLVAVRLALREPAYPAVMAATGLSYLAVLTALGTSVVGRIVIEGVA